MKKKAARRITTLAMAFACALLAGGALADAVYEEWTGNGDDSKWTTAGNWSPGSSNLRYVVFPSGQDCTVEIAAGQELWFFSIELPEGSGTVTLTGQGVLKSGSGAVVKIGSGRELRIDGPSVDLNGADTSESGFVNGTLRVAAGEVTIAGVPNTTTFGGNARLIVEGGTFGRENGQLCLTNNASLTVAGGRVVTYKGFFRAPDAPLESITRVLLRGGEFWLDNKEPGTAQELGDGAHFINRGGTLVWGNDDSNNNNSYSDEVLHARRFVEFLPSSGSCLVIPSSTERDKGALYFHEDDRVYTAGGTIYATNNTSAAAGNFTLYGTNVVLLGGATICANAVNVRNHRNRGYDLHLSRLNLGTGGIRRTAEDYGQQSLNFMDGIVFGAWGGEVPAEESEHLSVNLDGPVAYDTLDCFDGATARTINMSRVKMDGVTDFKATGGGTVRLSAETGADEFRTVDVADGTTLEFSGARAGLKAMNLRLGANATLKLDLSAGDYVDASASAEFGEGAKIVVTAFPSALEAGKPYPVYFAPAGTDPDLSNVEGACPSGWSFAKSGNAVYLSDGTGASWSAEFDGTTNVVNNGSFPVVCADAFADSADPLLFRSLDEGSLSLTGGASGARPLGFGGDVRIGGTWDVACLRSVPESGSAEALRNSRLTVMPGASLAVTAQTGDFNAVGAGALSVARTAAAAVGGADWTFTSANRHYVDGSLSVACPLVPAARQTFRGDGTLTLSGGVANAPDGGVRVEGNLTLVPADWTNDVTLSVKGNVTIAPSDDWTFGGDASLDVDDHSTLTIATGGHKVTLANAAASEGTVAVTGSGRVVLASAMSFGKVTCADGATLEISENLVGTGRDVLAVREDDESVAFAPGSLVEKRQDAATGLTVYFAKKIVRGPVLTIW